MKYPNVDRPSEWIRFRPAMCSGCWAGCCTMPVEINIGDLIRMGLVTEDEARGSLKKVAKKLAREGIIKNFRAGTGLFMLEQKNNRDCIFLGLDRLCTIYEKRPETCHKFPQVGPRPGYCPAGKIATQQPI